MIETVNPDDRGLSHLVKVKTAEGEREIDIYTEDGFRVLSNLWTRSGWQRRLSYEVTWLGIPIIQLPEDILMLQELTWKVRPDAIVECGIAHGGALVFYASMLELIGRGRVIGVDVEIRKYNRLAIEAHPLSRRIDLVEGSSTDAGSVREVRERIAGCETVMVVLDSDHSRDHVRSELDLYAPIVTPGSYLVVCDGVMEILADAPSAAPGWSTDNPKQAVEEFLLMHPEFELDPLYERLGVTYCHSGFLRRRLRS